MEEERQTSPKTLSSCRPIFTIPFRVITYGAVVMLWGYLEMQYVPTAITLLMVGILVFEFHQIREWRRPRERCNRGFCDHKVCIPIIYVLMAMGIGIWAHMITGDHQGGLDDDMLVFLLVFCSVIGGYGCPLFTFLVAIKHATHEPRPQKNLDQYCKKDMESQRPY